MIADFILLGLAIGLPFSNPWWFVPGFVVIILHYGYYDDMLKFVNKMMIE
jgi:hypothetical protein